MRRVLFCLVLLCFFNPLLSAARADDLPDLNVAIQVNAEHHLGPWIPVWRFFGYDEANFTYMRDGKKLLAELADLQPPQVYIRCHHLLTSGDGTPALKWSSTNAYTEDPAGNPIYDWTITDRIFDTYVQHGLKPYAQIGFMPKDLSTRPDLYPTKFDPNQRVPVDAGQAYPPKNYNKWRDLVAAWVAHCVQRYGRDEVNQWYWEVWNEPNISYWKGTQEEYFKLYDYAADGVRRSLPTARIGGPEQAGGGGKFLRAFLQHCIDGLNSATGGKGAPLDFISFHAKGSPKFADGFVRMGLGNQLNNIESGFSTMADFPQFKNTPIVIGESDPDGCAACTGPQLGYRNSTLYACYTAAAFAHKFEIADKYHINFQGALTWAFEFEDKPYFAGYRVLSTNGVDLPVLNSFRMMAKLHGDRIETASSSAVPLTSIEKSGVRGDPDVDALATLDDHQLAILSWNYHDNDAPGPAADITVTASNLPVAGATETEYRIDQSHSNAFTAWHTMGSPPNPTPDQYAQLQIAGRLTTLDRAQSIRILNGQFSTHIHLSRQGVSLIILTFN
jgi:xylan 1,4-beta-xylosidase